MVRKNSYPRILTLHRDTIIAHGEVNFPGLYMYSKSLSAIGAQRYTVTFPRQNIRKNNYPVYAKAFDVIMLNRKLLSWFLIKQAVEIIWILKLTLFFLL